MTTLSKKRKRLKTLLLIKLSLVAVLMASCKPAKELSQASVVKETVIESVEVVRPVIVPGDSLNLIALLECDSLNNVLLRQISENKSGGIATDLSLSEGKLTYTAKVDPKEINAIDKTVSTTSNSDAVKERVEVNTVYKRDFFWYTGLFSCIAALIYIIIKLNNIIKQLLKF